MKPNKAWIVTALSIGFAATVILSITWLPLALGAQTMEISEFRRPVAVFEFVLACVGMFWVLRVLVHAIKAR
jgi:hypothetical protein